MSTQPTTDPAGPQTPPAGNGAGREPIIRASGVWKIFGARADKIVGTPDADLPRAELRAKTGCVAAVRDVSFEVWPGEVFVVMGLSGSGKSTLVRTLIRLIEPSAGSIEIGGQDVIGATTQELRQLRRHSVSMIFQHFGLLAHRRVIDNVAFGLEIQGVPKAERLAKSREILGVVGLEDVENSFPDQLSGGMQQRVGVARAFVSNPAVMLYDEPFSALDPLIRRDMQDEVMRLQQETGKTMVFITHDLPEALRLGDRIAIMRDGKIVQLGTGEELVGSPADDYVANFVRDIPRSHVLTLRWIMRDPLPGEETGPRLDVTTTVRAAVPALAASAQPICAVEGDRIVGVVDREAVLKAMAGEATDVSAVTDTALPARPLAHGAWWRRKIVQVAAVVGVMIIAYQLWGVGADGFTRYTWPAGLAWGSLAGHLDSFATWLSDQRNAQDPSAVFSVFNGFASFLDNLVDWLTRLLLWMTWAGTTAVGALLAWRFGGRRAGLIALTACAVFALTGLWEQSMQTLALMLAAVGLSLAIGVPLGIAAGRSDRFLAFVTPVLDVMQIVPAFAYLMPVVILLSVGPGAAVVTTMIYAIPPAVRITALGIRGVPSNTVEAAVSMGSTRAQVLGKVQLPLARKTLLLGVNQTMLFALSMVVIAGLIGGQGLGDVVTSGLYSNPALAILAGSVIVVMAIAMDRVTERVADRTDPTRRHLTDDLKRKLRRFSIVAAIGCVGAVALARVLGVTAVYSRRSAQEWLLAKIQVVLDYVADPSTWVYSITSWISENLVQYFLVPFQNFMMQTPWFVMLTGLTLIAFIVSGRRPAVMTFLMLVSIGVLGQWEPAMDTASQVLVATVIAVFFGVVLGVWAAESRRVSQIVRPINDVLQTLPQLVYIIPFIYLMPVTIVPGVIAAVLYAVPVVIRLVESGVRGVEPNTIEAAASFGATKRQVLLKVKIPLAQDSIMLGINQGIIMVLSVVVIGGLVGSGGLGYEVAQGLNRGEFGLGVVASLAILALGIALDRVTQGNRRRRPDVI